MDDDSVMITAEDVERAGDVVYLTGAQRVLALALTSGRLRSRFEARRVQRAADTLGWLAGEIRAGRR